MILDYPHHASKITSIISRQPWQRRVIADISTQGSLFSEDRNMFGWVSQGNAIQLEFVCSFPDQLNYKLHGRWNLYK